MSEAKRKALMGEDGPVPHWDGAGVPFCSEECSHHDGKRCRLIGQRPGNICEPAVEKMAKALAL